MTIIKLLGKKRITRQLFRVCRLNKFDSLSQIEEYYIEHGTFETLAFCGEEEKKELESLIDTGLLRFAAQWDLPKQLLKKNSVVLTADHLLKKKLLSERQREVLVSSFRIYQESVPLTPCELADRMQLTEMSILRLRKLAMKRTLKGLSSLQLLSDQLLMQYEIDTASDMIIIDDTMALRVGMLTETTFSAPFLGLLFGMHLAKDFELLGAPEEVLAGNYLGIRHIWSGFYLLRKELAEGFDMNAFIVESFRLKTSGNLSNLNLRAYVSHFLSRSHASRTEQLIPIATEILYRELGLQVVEGQLLFPSREQFLLCDYAREALKILGRPSRQEVIRQKVEELHPGVVVDTYRFDLVLLDKWGFTGYEGLFGLKEWFQRGEGKLRQQDPVLLKELTQEQPKRSSTYWKLHWDQMLSDLKAFTDLHDRLPEKEGPVQEKKLWNWLRRQMADHRNGKLDPRQLHLYTEFRKEFPVRSGKFWKMLWDERLQELWEFSRAKGQHPRSSGMGEEKKLYKWLKLQRVLLKKGHLNLRQKTHLREYMEHYPLRAPKPKWELSFHQLNKFAETYSRLPAQKAEEEAEKELHYFWLRQLEKMKQGKLSTRQQGLIRELKKRYPYNSNHNKQKWDLRFSELEEFVRVHGVPSGHNLTGVAKTLRGWLIIQRVRMKKGELDARQQKLLEDFDARYQRNGDSYQKTEWNEKFGKLKAFVAIQDRLPRLQGENEEEKVLYRWYVTQRQRLKMETLDAMQQELLIEFINQYPVKSVAYLKVCWYDRMEELERFGEIHSRLPLSTRKDEIELYNWLKYQQLNRTTGKLDKFQQAKLQEFVERYPRKDYLDEHWQGRIGELNRFIRLHSRLPKRKAPAEERSLYYWVMKYLKKLDKGQLDLKKAGTLKKITRPYRRQVPEWEERFEEVAAFAKEHSRIPKRTAVTVEELQMNRWFLGQKLRLKKGSLDKGQQEKVAELVRQYGTGPGRSKPKESVASTVRQE